MRVVDGPCVVVCVFECVGDFGVVCVWVIGDG